MEPSPSAHDSFLTTDGTTAVVANLLVIGTLAYAAVLHAYFSRFYHLSVQEDGYLEWATFWAFMIAAGICVAGAILQTRKTRKLPWLLLGFGVFCFLLAMEEISWGQRIFGYRPPTYFLESNFQQELNIHNVFSTKLRKLALKAVIAGYGVGLPLIALLPVVRRRLSFAAAITPPVALVPAFIATFVAYEYYPWSFSGEWVELMLGLGFMFVALLRTSSTASRPSPAALVAVSWLAIVALGLASAAATSRHRGADPALVEAARVELEALKTDFVAHRLRTKCGLHKRVYSYGEKYGQDELLAGEFSRLAARGLPAARARYFLDPWNMPYWIRDRCSKDRSRRSVFLYSFGPNRRRDSSSWEIRGDDVGAFIEEAGIER